MNRHRQQGLERRGLRPLLHGRVPDAAPDLRRPGRRHRPRLRRAGAAVEGRGRRRARRRPHAQQRQPAAGSREHLPRQLPRRLDGDDVVDEPVRGGLLHDDHRHRRPASTSSTSARPRSCRRPSCGWRTSSELHGQRARRGDAAHGRPLARHGRLELDRLALAVRARCGAAPSSTPSTRGTTASAWCSSATAPASSTRCRPAAASTRRE